MSAGRRLVVAVVLCAHFGGGCSEDAIHNVPLVFLSFVQPYPLVARDCDLQIEFTPVGETPTPSAPADGCSERPTTGKAGDVFTVVLDVPPGEWTATVFLGSGDCVGSKNFVKVDGEPARVQVELTCRSENATVDCERGDCGQSRGGRFSQAGPRT